MKLYEVPRNTWVKLKESDFEMNYFFGHMDGMYSFGYDQGGQVCHFSANINAEILENQSQDCSDGMS